MKELFLNYSISSIKKYYPDYDDIKLAELKYGLEGYYLSFTKLIVISTISLLLNLFKEMIIMLIAFNVLRTTGFGIHAKKSINCWISSTIMFLLFPWLAKIIIIPDWLHIILGIVAVVLISIFAPADTVKRPLINKKKRMIYKVITTINSIILIIISFCVNPITSNLIIFGVYTEILMINPLTYKICGLPYNNYKTYGLNRNV